MAGLDRRRALAALLLVLVLAGSLRLLGIDWGGANSLHPDERFLAMVAASLESNDELLDYFDTESSTLNPENVGSRPGFVYGTYPLILVRLLGEAAGWTGMGELRTMGRLASTGWDLATIVMVYLLGVRLADRRTGLLAAFFLAVTVLHIQQSHYFTVDLAQAFFVTLALYIAVGIGRGREPDAGTEASGVIARLTDARCGPSLVFGAVAAAAVAAKLSAAPVVLLLPLAQLVRVLLIDRDLRQREVLGTLVSLVASGLVFGLVFRLLQPYAFAGPGFFGLELNPRWVRAIDSLRALTGPTADWPPSMQWARRSVFYSGRNLVCWGFGLPLGLLAAAGTVAAARRVLRRGVGPMVLVVAWTVGYFSWQSLQDNPTMRYQLPIYPTLTVLAAWLVTIAARPDSEGAAAGGRRRIATTVGVVVGLATLIYAAAFTGIYLRPITREAASRWMLEEIPGPLNLDVATLEGSERQPIAFAYDQRLIAGRPVEIRSRSNLAGQARALVLPRLLVGAGGPATPPLSDPPQLTATVLIEGGAESAATGRCAPLEPTAFSCTLELVEPLAVAVDDPLTIRLELIAPREASATPVGGAIANESSWDDGLPLRLDGYDPYGGIYQRDLNLELYWNDDAAKRERMLEILDSADYLAISSNRQWGSLPRIPERYPLVTAYYRHLIGCPPERSVASCFIAAEPGRAAGDLGFELAATFSSPPRLGPLVFNDQSADEAFTVYDHPKVLIFTKSPDYDPAHVREIFESVDLDRVVVKAPGLFGPQPADLMLPPQRFERMQRGGTWRERFPPESPLNRRPIVAAVVWYLALAVLGLGISPVVRWALPGLHDGGLPLARAVAMLLLAWLVWIMGSAGVAVVPTTVRLAALSLVAVGAAVAWRHRTGRSLDPPARRRQLLDAELVFATFFVLCLVVRSLNPDLWHPNYGGEKPMDLSYFTAVLKSVSFPPFDPWFAGGYINYYYFGFVIVGQLALALGIEPAIAYNLALPTVVAVAAAAAYSIASNVVRSGGSPPGEGRLRRLGPGVAGWTAAVAVAVMGNLHPLLMAVEGLIELGSGAGRGVAASLIAGAGRIAAGSSLPVPSHHWFWNPTRIIPDPDVMPITEFPAFTFIYGDLHAHLMDLPQVLLAMAFALAVLVGWSGHGGRGHRVAAVFFGALAVGAMRATNTWSYYPFLTLSCIAVAWASLQTDDHLPTRVAALRAALWATAFAVLSRVLYLPFDSWFGMGYTELQYWSQSRTPLAIYLEHWAPFLLPVATWIVVELRDWLAATPLSAVRPLKRHLTRILTVAVPAVVGQLLLLALGVRVSWLAWPLMVAAGLLLLRRDLPQARRFVLLVVGLGLGLTIAVELVTLKFDLGRMNTVFKFYYVTWALFAVSAAAALWWLASRRPLQPSWGRRLWWMTAAALLAGALLFPIRAIPAKSEQRLAPNAPHGLDGLAYLEQAIHHDQGRPLVLAEDLSAIRWLQRNVDGTPVIVEANIPEYRWGSRITINTGLPGVVGWNWHQRQQRGYANDRWVWDRVNAVTAFYTTDDPVEARDFLTRYDVRWIIVGQLERAYYPDDGLAKFPAWEGELWRETFRDGETSVYEVLPAPRSG